jgi:glucokinase
MTAFCPQTDQEWALRKFCVAQNGHATVESVVSGPGLRNTFNYLVSTGKHDAISPGISLDDLPQAISTAALAGTDAVAVEALTLMMRAWAAECQSISLRVMPFGGLYLAGGLTPKLISAIRETLVPEFLEGNPLMASIHKRCPLYAVMNESVGLLGAKVRAVQLLSE